MLELIAFALVLGFVVIFFVRRTSSNVALEADAARTQGDREVQVLRQMPPRAFERALHELAEGLGLQITESRW